MHEDSEMFGNTEKSDPRVYSFAKNIRNLRLDELPQLLNIMFRSNAFSWSTCRMD